MGVLPTAYDHFTDGLEIRKVSGAEPENLLSKAKVDGHQIDG